MHKIFDYMSRFIPTKQVNQFDLSLGVLLHAALSHTLGVNRPVQVLCFCHYGKYVSSHPNRNVSAGTLTENTGLLNVLMCTLTII